jgi:hypothetical protein
MIGSQPWTSALLDSCRFSSIARQLPETFSPGRVAAGLPKQVNELVRELKKESVITADDVPGRRFSAAANPVLRLAKPKT